MGIIHAPYHTKAQTAYDEHTPVRCLVWCTIRIMQRLVHGHDGTWHKWMLPTPWTMQLMAH